MSGTAPRWWIAAAAATCCAATVAALAVRAEIPLNERRSSYEDMSRDNKAMQDDDTSNPAMLAVLDGEALWQTKAGAADKSCADCHGDAKEKMKGVAKTIWEKERAKSDLTKDAMARLEKFLGDLGHI